MHRQPNLQSLSHYEAVALHPQACLQDVQDHVHLHGCLVPQDVQHPQMFPYGFLKELRAHSWVSKHKHPAVNQNRGHANQICIV